MLDRIRSAGRSRWLAPLAALTLAAGCRERAPQRADSSLAQDLELAQRALPPQMVFNDAPLGAAGPAATAAAAPTPDPSPARAPRAMPSPRRATPPAAVAPAPRQPAPQPVAPAQRPAPAAGVIGAGTRIGMTTNARVCTRDLLVGDKYTATVASATVGSNGAVIPAGSTVVLEVTSVERADPIEASRMGFRVRSIDVNGTPQQAAGEVATLGALEQVQASGGNDRTKIIGGAVAGAVLGRIFGGSTKATVIGAAAGGAAGTAAARASRSGDACLPQGSTLQLTLARDIVFGRDGPI